MKQPEKSKNSTRPWIFTVVGIIITIFNYAVYELLAFLISGENLLWLSYGLAYLIATFFAYLLHSKITWKERKITKTNILYFFLWNIFMAIASSALTSFVDFLLLPPLAFLNPPLSSSIIFIIVTAIVLIVNFFFYDRIVFKTTKKSQKKGKK